MILFLYGEDSFRSRRKLNELKEKFISEIDKSGHSLTVLDGESASMEKINEATAPSSLFVKKRMVIIERLLANKSKSVLDQVHNYLKANGGAKDEKKDENIIIFWDDVSGEKLGKSKLFKLLSSLKYSQNFKSLSNTESTAWVKKEIEARGLKIRQKAAAMLAGIFGNDLWQLNNEIEKLVNYKEGHVKKFLAGGQEVVIEEEDVEALGRGNVDENIFALTDAISNKNKPLAMRLFENEIEAGVAETNLIHMIIRQFRILLLVRESFEMGKGSRIIINQLKLHPFVVQKSLSQVRNFSLPFLKKIFSHLLKIDAEIKTGRAEAKSALNLLMAKI